MNLSEESLTKISKMNLINKATRTRPKKQASSTEEESKEKRARQEAKAQRRKPRSDKTFQPDTSNPAHAGSEPCSL